MRLAEGIGRDKRLETLEVVRWQRRGAINRFGETMRASAGRVHRPVTAPSPPPRRGS
jgi:hypothetical protein